MVIMYATIGRDHFDLGLARLTGFQHPADEIDQFLAIAPGKDGAVVRRASHQRGSAFAAHELHRRIDVDAAAVAVIAKNGIGQVFGQGAELFLATGQ